MSAATEPNKPNDRLSLASERCTPVSRRGRSLLESLAAFTIGAVLMHVAYGSTANPAGGEVGVPGHDSFYHIRMAAMLPEHGLVKHFPWLRYAYFTDEGDAFVSHHYGFHFLLLPFVKLSNWLMGSELAGGRWAMIVCFGLVALLFDRLMQSLGVRRRWLWLLLFAFLPYQFFTRHAFVRAISSSLVFMLLILLFLFRRRPLATALASAGYVHLYLGGVLFAPIMVGCFACSHVIGPRRERVFPWRLVLFAAAGWAVGILAHPYREGIASFLKLQVFGTGLSPDISVGREWNSYEGVWFFAQMCGVLLIVWTVTAALRMRIGPTLNAHEWTLLLLSLCFLALTLKARRFIEYWPIFSLLSAATLVEPLLRRREAVDADDELEGSGTPSIRGTESARTESGGAVAGHVLRAFPWMTGLMGVLLVAGVAWSAHEFLAGRTGGTVPAVSYWSMAVLGSAFSLLAWLETKPNHSHGSALPGRSVRRGVMGFSMRRATAPAVGLAAFAVAAGLGAGQWHRIQKDGRCRYDLPAVRALMDFLRGRSEADSVVFTDDWDVFPIFFFHNAHNRYVVGLDPKFTHHRRPDLWERYVKITRGEVPAHVSYQEKDEHGELVRRNVVVRLEDIRDVFGARFVVTDRDHKGLASRLAAAPQFAELVYPTDSQSESRDAPYLAFRIRSTDEGVGVDEATGPCAPESDCRFLADLIPTAVEQEWGTLRLNTAVGGGVQLLGGRTHDRGLGTHARSRIEFEIPAGFERFDAVVGLDQAAGGQGSVIVSVQLDEREVYRSPRLSQDSPPIPVRVNLKGARTLILHADPTEDGNAFDHVDWADARFERIKP
jgi:hypothetical protein